MAEFNDPFTQVYKYVIGHLQNDTDLLAVVAKNNIHDLTASNANIILNDLGPADFPAIVLVPTGSDEINLKATSSSAQISQSFSLEFATNSKRLSNTTFSQRLFFPMKWLIIKALYPFTGGHTFTSESGNFNLIRLELSSSDEDFIDEDRGKVAWNSVLDIEAILSIPRETLEQR